MHLAIVSSANVFDESGFFLYFWTGAINCDFCSRVKRLFTLLGIGCFLFTLSVFLGQQTFVLGYIGRFRVTVLLWPSKKVNKTKAIVNK
jgi:hypothetical protein